MTHENIKQIVADRLRAIGGDYIVLTEVLIKKANNRDVRADIVMVRYISGIEITVIEVKTRSGEVIRGQKQKWHFDKDFLEDMMVFNEYANETYLCLPKKECSSEIFTLCNKENIGLVAVNIDADDGPLGFLNKKVKSIYNAKPEKWLELDLRLEKFGV